MREGLGFRVLGGLREDLGFRAGLGRVQGLGFRQKVPREGKVPGAVQSPQQISKPLFHAVCGFRRSGPSVPWHARLGSVQRVSQNHLYRNWIHSRDLNNPLVVPIFPGSLSASCF